MSNRYMTRASVLITKAGDPNQGKAGVVLTEDPAAGTVTVECDGQSQTWVYQYADIQAL